MIRMLMKCSLIFQEIYGESWEQIATLLPFRTTDEVQRFGVSYLKVYRGVVYTRQGCGLH